MPHEELTGWVYVLTLLIVGGLIIYFPVLDWVLTWEVYR